MNWRDVPMPTAIRRLPRNPAGYPIPTFVEIVDGAPDFRVMSVSHFQDAIRRDLCWICGESRRRGVSAFTVGPMCGVNRISAEPPSHEECAVYAARTCPFLSTPSMSRRVRHLPQDHIQPAGMITRNPGVALVWCSYKWRTIRVDEYTVLIEMGAPVKTSWWCQGRPATRAEVTASIESGLPLLYEDAERNGGRHGRDAVDRQVRDIAVLLPNDAP